MIERYIDTANELMNFSNLCEDEEAANILKDGSMKIYQLVKAHGGIIKTAQEDIETDAK